jgi:hypothetical protein
MTDRELLGSVATHTGITVLAYGAALILPSLLVWAGFGFIAWNWNPGDWTEQFRAASAFFALMLTIPAVGFLAGVV